MRLRVPGVLTKGTRVKIRRPGTGESGVWLVGGRVVGSGLDDPAYDIRHAKMGRARIMRRSRLKLLRAKGAGRPPWKGNTHARRATGGADQHDPEAARPARPADERRGT